jgi:ribosomal protein S18 acetylase RimI-like enzyme
MSLSIRHAEKRDAEQIAQFQIDMALETEDKILDPQTVLTAVRSVFDDSGKGFYLIGELDGRVVCSLMITYEWSDWRNSNLWWIQSVFVATDQRGNGFFKSMFNRVVEMAKEKDVMFVRLYVETENDRAQKVYESLGMKRMPYYMYDIKI